MLLEGVLVSVLQKSLTGVLFREHVVLWGELNMPFLVIFLDDDDYMKLSLGLTTITLELTGEWFSDSCLSRQYIAILES